MFDGFASLPKTKVSDPICVDPNPTLEKKPEPVLESTPEKKPLIWIQLIQLKPLLFFNIKVNNEGINTYHHY